MLELFVRKLWLDAAILLDTGAMQRLNRDALVCLPCDAVMAVMAVMAVRL